MKIAVIGTGYVGLVSGTCFADLLNICNKEIIENAGFVYIAVGI